jgi:hypothetical protein
MKPSVQTPYHQKKKVTQKAEIRRMVFRSQSQANSSQDPILKNQSQKRVGRVAQAVRVPA